MDHAYIDEHQIAERYLQGRLPPEEAAIFQEHSLTCAECLDRLEMAETLQSGLRQIAAQEIAATAVRTGLFARLVRSRLTPWVTTFLLVVALLPAGLLWRQRERLEGELTETRRSLERARAERSRPGPDPAALDTLRRQLAEEHKSAVREREERERLALELQQARTPVINVPVVPLSPERSGEGSAAPSHRITLAPATGWVVLSLELAAADFPRYRATLRGPQGASLWQQDGLAPDATDTLHLSLPASLLPDGDLAIEVDGLPGQGSPSPVSRFPFRIVRR